MAKKRTPKKKTPKKKTGNKSSSGPPKQGELGDWQPKIPKKVQDAADEYDKAHSAKSKATAALNTAKDNLIVAMRETKTERCPVRNGQKILVHDNLDKIRYEVPKKKDTQE